MPQSELEEAKLLFNKIDDVHSELSSVLSSNLKDDGNQEIFLTELYNKKAELIEALVNFDNSEKGQILKTEHSEFRNENICRVRTNDAHILAELKNNVDQKAENIRKLANQKSLLIYSKERIK